MTQSPHSMPVAIRGYIWLTVASIVLGIVSAVAASMEYSVPGLFLPLIVGIAIQAIVITLVVKRKNFVRYIVLVVYVLGLILSVGDIGALFELLPLSGAISVITFILGAIALALLFSSEASAWFTGGPEVAPRSPEQRRQDARRLLVGGVVVTGFVALVIAGAIVIPMLKDWDAVLAACLEGTPENARRDAEKACDEIVDEDDIDVAMAFAANLRLAQIDEGKENWAGASIHYGNAADLDDSNFEVWLNAGIANVNRASHYLAIPRLDHAVELRPDDPEARRYRGLALMLRVYQTDDLGRLDEAIADMELAQADFPDDVELLEYLGNALRLADRFDQSLAVFEHAHALEPDNNPVIMGMAMTLAAAERYEDALVWLRSDLIQVAASKQVAALFVILSECRLGNFGAADEAFDIHRESGRLSIGVWTSLLDEFGYGEIAGPDGETTGEEPVLAQYAVWKDDGCPLPDTAFWG